MSKGTQITVKFELAKRIRQHRAEAREIRRSLQEQAPALISVLRLRGQRSYRDLAKALSLSATYLCRIQHGQEPCSPMTFLRLANELHRRLQLGQPVSGAKGAGDG